MIRSRYPDIDLDPKYCGIHCRAYGPTHHHCGECHASMKKALG